MTYPAIVEQAVRENAEIWWVDQTGARNASNCIKGYSPRGVTPTLPIASHHIGVNMICAFTNKGKLRYSFYRSKFNQEIFISFLTRLIKANDRKVFAIVDNSTTHHGLIVRDWKEKQAEVITMFYLPSRSPELNPVEYLNNNLKRDLLYRGYSVNEDEIEAKSMSIMRSIQSTKGRVASFFDHQDVKYAKSQE